MKTFIEIEPGFIREEAFRPPLAPSWMSHAIAPTLQHMGWCRRDCFGTATLGDDVDDASAAVRIVVGGHRYRGFVQGIHDRFQLSSGRVSSSRSEHHFWKLAYYGGSASAYESPHFGIRLYRVSASPDPLELDAGASASLMARIRAIAEALRIIRHGLPGREGGAIRWPLPLKVARDRIIAGVYRDTFMLGSVDESPCMILADEIEEGGAFGAAGDAIAEVLRAAAGLLAEAPTAIEHLWPDQDW